MVGEKEAVEKATKFLVERYKRQPPAFKKADLSKKGERFKLPGMDEVFIHDETYWSIFFNPVTEGGSYILVYVYTDGSVEQPASRFC